MPRRKLRIAPSPIRRLGRQNPSCTATPRLGSEQTPLQKCSSSSSASESPASLVEVQNIIKEAQGKDEGEQKAAIIAAIKRLYTFSPRDGQREALRHLIYLRKDMGLIARTSFGKSMILQAVSLLIGGQLHSLCFLWTRLVPNKVSI
jgi:hypothetical protein